MQNYDVSIRISGANGDGIDSIGFMIGKSLARNGLYIFGYRGYQSVIRGGSVWYQIRASTEKLYTHGEVIDILISFDLDGIKNSLGFVKDGGIVIYDSKTNGTDELAASSKRNIRFVKLPLLDSAVKSGGDIYRNTVAFGILSKIVGIKEDFVIKSIADRFKKKPGLVTPNVTAAKIGYELDLGIDTSNFYFGEEGEPKREYMLSGNEAIAIGAAAAGCKFYAAYPMTPASSILDWFASHENHGILYKQPEDEITAINMTIGAASAGVRAMCGTSGGGFSLMVEGLGLAGILEVPIVVVEAQRSGPSTGLPTKTEQGDLLFVMNASQGEFPRVIIAPRNVEECFYETGTAFNIAEKYQCPVIILSDLFLSEHIESVNIEPEKVSIERGKIANEKTDGEFKRYLITEDGVSPRAIPGTKDLAFVAPSDDHDEYGNLITDVFVGTPEAVELRRKMHSKRMRKLETMVKNGDIKMPEVIGEGAGAYLVAFGSSTYACTEAIGLLKSRGVNVGLISFSYLHPMDSEKVGALLSGKRLIDVESNYTAQFARLIRMNTGIDIKERILRYDGEAFTGEYLCAEVMKMLKG